MADIGQYLDKVGKYYIYKKANAAFQNMIVDFKKDNQTASLTIESGYYSKFEVIEELRKRLKTKGKEGTDAPTKELLASKETVLSLTEEDPENYTKILTYIKTTKAEEYEPTLLPTIESASTPSAKIIQIPTLEIKKFKNVDDINDIRKSARIVTIVAEDMKVPATQNWLLNNSYKYGFLLYLNVALYYIGLDKITAALGAIKPANGTAALTQPQIEQQNLILKNIIGRYQINMEAVNLLKIDAATALPPVPQTLPTPAGGKSPYADGKKPLPILNTDSMFNPLHPVYKGRYVGIDPGGDVTVLNLDEVEKTTVNGKAKYVPKTGVDSSVTAIMGVRFATEAEASNSKLYLYTKATSRKAEAIKTITLHFVAGNPGGHAEQSVQTVHKPFTTVDMPGSKHHNQKVFRDVLNGLHYAVDNYGHIAKGGDELTTLYTSNGWNYQAIGIEMAGIGGLDPVLHGITPAEFNAKYPPGIVHKAYPDGAKSQAEKVVQAKGEKLAGTYPFPPTQPDPSGRDFEWANLGYTYNGSQYYNEFSEALIESLELWIRDLMKRYTKIRESMVNPGSVWKVFGLNEKPTPTGKQQGSLSTRNKPGEYWAIGQKPKAGIFGHSTGREGGGGSAAGWGEMHTDTCPTPRLIAMLLRLGYKDE